MAALEADWTTYTSKAKPATCSKLYGQTSTSQPRLSETIQIVRVLQVSIVDLEKMTMS